MSKISVLPYDPYMTELLVSDVKSLNLLSRLVGVINTGYTFEQVFDLLYQQIREIIPCHRLGVAIIDDKKEKLTLVACRSDGPISLPTGYSGHLKGSSLDELLRTRQTRIINNLEDYLRKKPSSDSTRLIVKEGMRSSLTLPLLVQNNPIGVMFFSSREKDAYNESHEDFLKLIAGHIAITMEKSRLMDEIRLKQEYLENILQNSADAIVVVDRENRVQTWNRGAQEIFGYEPDEVIGKELEILVPPEQHAHGEMKQIKERIEREGAVRNLEVVRVTKDGRRIVVSVTSTVLKDKKGRVIGRSSIVRDITPLKKLQEELQYRASMAALGELAATIAHEVKNPLAGISGAMQVLSEGFPNTDPRKTVMGEVLRQVKRLDETVRDLLLFAKPWKPSPMKVDLGGMIDHILSTLRTTMAVDNVTFKKECRGDCIAFADPQQMEHLFVNLFQNALQAMPTGGSITVGCRSDSSHVYVEITDTGVGIPPQHQANLFKPFFSTKARGTGLGLCISKKIIDAHGGDIALDSTAGKGTKVKITLPRFFEET